MSVVFMGLLRLVVDSKVCDYIRGTAKVVCFFAPVGSKNYAELKTP
jgi:hypothetical protein